MNDRPRIRGTDHAGLFAEAPSGPHNDITDVGGVTVGHVTVTTTDGRPVTGVTVISPHDGVLCEQPVAAAVHVINGFGKATGLSQIGELGLLETPIALTNTLSVGAAHEGLVRLTIGQSPTAVSVNSVVGECNDAAINDIRALAVRPEAVLEAYAARRKAPELGSVGAGSGMVAFGWKGGLGSASRVVVGDGQQWTIGVLVLANFGLSGELVVHGMPVGAKLDRIHGPQLRRGPTAGSCFTIVATDAPLTSRQLGRIGRRAQNGLARVGGNTDHDSGEYVLTFSSNPRSRSGQVLDDASPELNALFRGVADGVESSVLESLALGADTPACDGSTIRGLPMTDVLAMIGRP